MGRLEVWPVWVGADGLGDVEPARQAVEVDVMGVVSFHASSWWTLMQLVKHLLHFPDLETFEKAGSDDELVGAQTVTTESCFWAIIPF